MDSEPYCSRCSRLRPVYDSDSRFPAPPLPLPYPPGIAPEYCSGCGRIHSYDEPQQLQVTPLHNSHTTSSNAIVQAPEGPYLSIVDKLIDPKLRQAGYFQVSSSDNTFPEKMSLAEQKAVGGLPRSVASLPLTVNSEHGNGKNSPFSTFRAFVSAVNAARAGPSLLPSVAKALRPAVARTTTLRVPTKTGYSHSPLLRQKSRLLTRMLLV